MTLRRRPIPVAEPDPRRRPRLFGRREWERHERLRRRQVLRNRLQDAAVAGDAWAEDQLRLLWPEVEW